MLDMGKKQTVSVKETKTEIFDEQFFVYLYIDLRQELITYGIKLCRDEDTVLDCIHEVFLDIWQNKHKYASLKDPKPYILRSLRNQIISRLRSLNRLDQFRINRPFQASAPPSFVIPHEDILIDYEDEQIKAGKIKNLLAALTDSQREIIFLKYFSGLNDQQIARITGLKYQSVRNLLYKSLKKLREFAMLWLSLLMSFI